MKRMLKKILILYLRYVQRLNTPARIIRFALSRYRHEVYLVEPETLREYTFGDLLKRSSHVADYLFRQGLQQGDVIVFSAENCCEYYELRTAAHLSGIIFFGLSPFLRENDLAYFIDKTNARILFYRAPGGSRRQLVDYQQVAYKSGLELSVNLDSPEYEALFQSSGPPQKSSPTVCLATYNTSSGTTRRTPKVIPLDGQNWVESFYLYIANSDVRPGEKTVFMSALPLVTAGSTTFLPTMMAGVKVIVASGYFDAEKMVRSIKQHAVNRLYITPSWLIELLEWCRQHDETLESLEQIITGTERLPTTWFKEAVDFWGPKIVVGYGMVEVLPPLTMLSPCDYFSRSGLKISSLDSAGKAVQGVRVKIVSQDQALAEVPQAAIGRIAVQSPTMFTGYLADEGELESNIVDGWYVTSDYGYLDPERFLHIVGRQREMFCRQGKTFFAKDVEDLVYQLDFVKRCCAVADDEKLIVYVSLRSGMESKTRQDEIEHFCRNLADRALRPDGVKIKKLLPINSLGKLDRKALEEEFYGQK